MKKINTFLLSVFILVSLFSGCGEKKSGPKMTFKTPIEYNNYIVSNQTKIMQKMIDLSKTFDIREGKEMDAKLSELGKQIDTSLKIIEDIGPYKDNTEFQQATLKLFQFYKVGASVDFKEIIEILKKKDTEIMDYDIQRINELNVSINNREQAVLKEFGAAQKAFSTQYKFGLLDSNKMQNDIDKMGEKANENKLKK